MTRRKVGRRVRPGKRQKSPRATPALEFALPIPPGLEGLKASDLSRAWRAMRALDEWDRARGYLRALQASLAKCGIKLVGVNAVRDGVQ